MSLVTTTHRFHRLVQKCPELSTVPGYLLASLTVYQRTLSSAPTVAASACSSQSPATVRSAVSHTLISL